MAFDYQTCRVQLTNVGALGKLLCDGVPRRVLAVGAASKETGILENLTHLHVLTHVRQ